MMEAAAGRSNRLVPDQLRAFAPFRGLPEDQLLVLSHTLETRRIASGGVLFSVDDDDAYDYFLHSGQVRLKAFDGGMHTVEAGSAVAANALARLRPRRFTAMAEGPVEVLLLHREVLATLQPPQASPHMEYEVSELEEGGLFRASLLSSFKSDLATNRFHLPTLPEVALRIRELLDSETVDLADVAALVNTDPAIAAKLVRAANSPVYRGAKPCDSIQSAIGRLGFQVTRQLVMSFVLRDVFSARSPLLRQRMQEVWLDSVEVAAIAFGLARHLRRFSAEEALLAGLLHSIGVVGVLAYAENYPELASDADSLQQLLLEMEGEVGELILTRWGFASELVEVARASGRWHRHSDGDADYCDLVIVARLHAALGKRVVPPMAEVPAFSRICRVRQLTPDAALAVLQEATETIAQMRDMLGL